MLLLLLLASLLCACSGGKIDHVVVVMVENQSFDRIFGQFPGVRSGLTGKETNPVAGGGSVTVDMDPPQIPNCDPDHGVPATTFKLYQTANPTNESVPTMKGFAEWEEEHWHHNASTRYCDVLSGYPPHMVPVSHWLASNYALFDGAFASVPGPTWPNRWAALMGTSGGCTDTMKWFENTTGLLYPGRTIFDQVKDAGLDWKYYYQTTPWELMLAGVKHNPSHLHTWDAFLEDCSNGTLPAFSWVNPRSGVDNNGRGSNDWHPTHDSALAELFLKEVYEAVRASPQWKSSALIIMFDEHGGYSDSVAPPHRHVPPPDHIVGQDGFTFDRLGVRVPLLVVSPYVKQGVLVHEDDGIRPTPDSKFDHTSVLATARELLGINEAPLTRRDAWASRFTNIFMDSPRLDCPLKTASPLPPILSHSAERELPVSHLQMEILRQHELLSHRAVKPQPSRQGHVHPLLQSHFASLPQSYRHAVRIVPEPALKAVEKRFAIDWEKKTIYTMTMNDHGVPYCLTADHDEVVVDICRQAHGETQSFTFERNGRIKNGDRCMQVVPEGSVPSSQFGTYRLTLQPCNGQVEQAFAWYGSDFKGMPIPGAKGDNEWIVWGDGESLLSVVKSVN